MKIGIIGNGVVGAATAAAFTPVVEGVRIYDIKPSHAMHSLAETLDSDIIFICLPTPQREGSMECDVSAVDSFFSSQRNSRKNFVLRSTVPIGYTEGASAKYSLGNLLHFPEFLTARTAVEDACNPKRIVIGFLPGYRHGAFLLKELCRKRWPNLDPLLMRTSESQAVKLFQNSFSAVKIAFFNEVRTLSDKMGLDWERVLGAVLAGGWINPMHTQVPGPDGKRGFGGTCLPKDCASLGFQMLQLELRADMVLGAYCRNLVDRDG